ncbi:MAG: hypothetical protein EXR00_07335 [Alphaproteobacteria bacterium]|nr:hypothetical protein [Alphaproteobacteria bacterium]
MELNLPVTLIIVALTMGLFGFATIRAKKPAEPLKVRFINYHVVQLVCIVVILLMAAHLMTLVAGNAPGNRF